MLTIILMVLAAAGCIVWAVKSDWDIEEVAIALAIVMCICVIVTLLTLCNRGKRFDYTIEKYNNLKAQVEDYNSLPDSAKLISLEYDIRDDVLDMNNTISKHEVMSQSIWKGLWFSEEVGNLPKLHIIGKNDNELPQATELPTDQNQ